MIRLEPGQKIVCINAGCDDPRFIQDMSGLVEGQIYTVRWVGTPAKAFVERFPDRADMVLVGLEEIIRPRVPGTNDENGFDARRFRPVTDISVFEAMLTAVPHELV